MFAFNILITIMLKTKISPTLLAQEYAKGMSMIELGEKYGVTRQRIHQVLKSHGVDAKTNYRERVVDRFWAKVKKTDDCWLWRGTKSKLGYGRFSSHGKAGYAHRFSLSLLETLDPQLEIDHLCRNRACVNPEHLEQVTHKINIARAPVHATKRNTKFYISK